MSRLRYLYLPKILMHRLTHFLLPAFEVCKEMVYDFQVSSVNSQAREMVQHNQVMEKAGMAGPETALEHMNLGLASLKWMIKLNAYLSADCNLFCESNV